MHNRIILVSLLLFLSLSVYSQTEAVKDSVRIESKDSIMNKQLIKPKENQRISAPVDMDRYVMEADRHEHVLKQMKFDIPEFYIGPDPNPNSLKIKGERMPGVYDYSYVNFVPIRKELALLTSSLQNTYIGVGAMRMINANLNYALTDWLTVSGGVYGAKYVMDGFGGIPQHYNDLGFKASLRLRLNDKFYLRGHGMYSINADEMSKSYRPGMSGMFPQTYYGGGLEYKITDKFGVEAGMVRELNPLNGKWVNKPYIMPVFYSK